MEDYLNQYLDDNRIVNPSIFKTVTKEVSESYAKEEIAPLSDTFADIFKKGHLQNIDASNQNIVSSLDWVGNQEEPIFSENQVTFSKIKIPDNIKKVGAHRFCFLMSDDKTSFAEVSVKNFKNLSEIGDYAFQGSGNKTKFIVEDLSYNIDKIGIKAFTFPSEGDNQEYLTYVKEKLLPKIDMIDRYSFDNKFATTEILDNSKFCSISDFYFFSTGGDPIVNEDGTGDYNNYRKIGTNKEEFGDTIDFQTGGVKFNFDSQSSKEKILNLKNIECIGQIPVIFDETTINMPDIRKLYSNSIGLRGGLVTINIGSNIEKIEDNTFLFGTEAGTNSIQINIDAKKSDFPNYTQWFGNLGLVEGNIPNPDKVIHFLKDE